MKSALKLPVKSVSGFPLVTVTELLFDWPSLTQEVLDWLGSFVDWFGKFDRKVDILDFFVTLFLLKKRDFLDVDVSQLDNFTRFAAEKTQI